MCCTHSYDMQVSPTISGQSSEAGVRQRLDKGWTEVGVGLDRDWSTEAVSCWMSRRIV